MELTEKEISRGIEMQYGMKIERCPECNEGVELGTLKWTHMYTIHPNLVTNQVDCYACGRVVTDPVKLPLCQLPSCFCLVCFFKLLTIDQIEECPVCMSDIAGQIKNYIDGKPPEYDISEILIEDLEIFIDAKKAEIAYAWRKKQDLKILQRHEKKVLTRMKKKHEVDYKNYFLDEDDYWLIIRRYYLILF